MNQPLPQKQKQLIEKCLDGALAAKTVVETVEWLKALHLSHGGQTWAAIDRLGDPIAAPDQSRPARTESPLQTPEPACL
jgi:hypothetical protein